MRIGVKLIVRAQFGGNEMDLKNFLSGAVREVIQTVLISLAIYFIVNIFLVQPHRVKGESMVPNFADGELLLTEKVTYHL